MRLLRARVFRVTLVGTAWFWFCSFWFARVRWEGKQTKSQNFYTLPCFSIAGYSCGGIRTQVAGVISSSNFPRDYKSNTTCVWKISVNTANQITLNFTDFELENSSRCERAYVQVYDGPNTTDPSLGTFCGSEIPPGVRSSGNHMLVVFQAYRGNNFKGFRAYYDSGKYLRRIFLHCWRLITEEIYVLSHDAHLVNRAFRYTFTAGLE